ncbi:zinc-binding alcohol dehydrogenase family protein, partial [bacterium]|nr:zinc-binding alcohol dehydrogenase family protein [bacterium]
DQFSNFTGKTPHKGPDWQTGLIAGFLKNLNILGNCLGLSQDLQQAIDDYASGSLNVIIDSMHSGNQAGNFIERTYNAKDRFGKVVYKYD